MADPSRAAGRVVAVPLAALARRRNGKPMHPRGVVCHAVLDRHGSDRPWGVPFLDATGREDVVVRLSRSMGLPAPLPDLLGLAVRLGGDPAPVDLLLSSTARGRLARLVPALRRDTACAYGSVMAYRSAAGPIRIVARPLGGGAPSEPGPLAAEVRRQPLVWVLAAARGLGAEQPFARLTVGEPVAGFDPDVQFDAVRHPPPGLHPDGPLARFRAPSYAAARAARRTLRAEPAVRVRRNPGGRLARTISTRSDAERQ